MSAEATLILKYEDLIKFGQPNPYYLSKQLWINSIEEKILELKQIINKNNR